MTMIKANALSGPFKRFQADGAPVRMQFKDNEHTPDNKRPGRVESQLIASFDRMEHMVSICFEEITTSENGRIAGRTITATLSMKQAQRIADFIKTGA